MCGSDAAAGDRSARRASLVDARGDTDCPLCGVLRDLHDEPEALVARAYGWPWPLDRAQHLERLVALHTKRVAEEARSVVRWLRPDHQAPAAGDGAVSRVAAGAVTTRDDGATDGAAPLPWPVGAIDQLAALTRFVATTPLTRAVATARSSGAPEAIVARHLETLALLGEVRAGADGRYGGVTV